MPKTVTLVKNPNFDAKGKSAADIATYKAIKPITTSYQTALENMKNSGGMFMIKVEKADKAPSAVPTLEDMAIDDLKLMMVQLGVKTDKQLKRSEVITVIRKKMGEIDIVEDE